MKNKRGDKNVGAKIKKIKWGRAGHPQTIQARSTLYL